MMKDSKEAEATTSAEDSAKNESEEAQRRKRLLETPEIIKPEWKELPDELKNVDFSKRIVWGKFDRNNPPSVPVGAPPVYTDQSPALCHQIHAVCGRARACTIHFAPKDRDGNPLKRPPVPTPRFMPVGTKGTLKGILPEEIEDLNCPMILGNTYHLAIQPGTHIVKERGGLHQFMGAKWELPDEIDPVTQKPYHRLSYNMLTDSGGFQMVSLAALSQVTEEGVIFENPFSKSGETMLLRPEDSIRYQNDIGADVIMALDDVVSSVAVDQERFLIATYRTLRWLDRCFDAHQNAETQNLFPIVQGALDVSMGGMREKCLAGFQIRDDKIPGYAIGGLAGGEDKDDFWKVVDQCCKALPDSKPRYLMGVGYPLDLVVCTALGVDMYDCVYPTRTARFGVALVTGTAPGTLKLKNNACATDSRIIEDGCICPACTRGIPRSRLYSLFKVNNVLAVQLVSQHNVAYMMKLVADMRAAIIDQSFPTFVNNFIQTQFGGKDQSPKWVQDALDSAGIPLR